MKDIDEIREAIKHINESIESLTMAIIAGRKYYQEHQMSELLDCKALLKGIIRQIEASLP